jgi:hypothetical protein
MRASRFCMEESKSLVGIEYLETTSEGKMRQT